MIGGRPEAVILERLEDRDRARGRGAWRSSRRSCRATSCRAPERRAAANEEPYSTTRRSSRSNQTRCGISWMSGYAPGRDRRQADRRQRGKDGDRAPELPGGARREIVGARPPSIPRSSRAGVSPSMTIRTSLRISRARACEARRSGRRFHASGAARAARPARLRDSPAPARRRAPPISQPEQEEERLPFRRGFRLGPECGGRAGRSPAAPAAPPAAPDERRERLDEDERQPVAAPPRQRSPPEQTPASRRAPRARDHSPERHPETERDSEPVPEAHGSAV